MLNNPTTANNGVTATVTDNVTAVTANNGNISIDPYDLATAQGTIKGLVTCLDDVDTILSLAIQSDHQSTANALLRLARIAVEQWAEIGQSEVEFLDGFLKGTVWELGGNV